MWAYLQASDETQACDAEEGTLAILPATDFHPLVLDRVRKQCAAEPLTLAVDDLQFATPADLGLVESLLSLTQELPLLLLLAGDSAPEGAGAVRAALYGSFLTRMAGSDRCRRLVLEPLAAGDVVRNLTDRGLDEVTAQRIHALAGGSPGLINALVESLHRGATLQRIMASEVVSADELTGLRERLQAMGDVPTRLLRALVELGGESDVDGLVKASGLPRLAVQSRLRDLMKLHGWVRLADNRVELTQPYLGSALGP